MLTEEHQENSSSAIAEPEGTITYLSCYPHQQKTVLSHVHLEHA